MQGYNGLSPTPERGELLPFERPTGLNSLLLVRAFLNISNVNELLAVFLFHNCKIHRSIRTCV